MSTDCSQEEWRPVTIDDGMWSRRYEVSNLGRVRTIERIVRGRLCVVKIMAQRPNNDGYMRVEFSVNGKRNFAKVHSLVADAFVGTRGPGMTVNHINGDKTDNTARNLEYLSRADNIRHSWAIGLRDGIGAKISQGRRAGIARRSEWQP